MAATLSAGVAILLPHVAEQGADMLAGMPAHAQSIAKWEHGWSRAYEPLRIPAPLRQGIDRSVLTAGEAALASAAPRRWDSRAISRICRG